MVRIKKTNPIQPKKPKKTVVKERSDKPYCCICMDEIQPKKLASLDVCNHQYCKGCIETWAKTENSCPQCKRKFKKITHIKKGCKKKKVSTEVEDKRQRPDHHGDDYEFGDDDIEFGEEVGPNLTVEAAMMLNDNVAAAFRALEASLRASAATHTPNARAILRAQISFTNVCTDPNLCNELLTAGVTPFDVPIHCLYELESRVNIILFFWFDDEFANILANLLVESRSRESAIQLFVKAECVFNVIHRFMSSITYTRNETTDQTAVYRLRDVWHQLKTIVYGTEGSAETPVDVENMVERRAHPAIPFGGICRHRILKSIKEIASGEEHPTIYI